MNHGETRMVRIIEKRNLWLSISIGMLIVGLGALGLWQLKLGIDFTGGSLLEVEYTHTHPSIDVLKKHLDVIHLTDGDVKTVGERGVIFRLKTIDEDTHQKLITELKKDDKKLAERIFESIGPVIGKELKTKSLLAIAVALLMILVYIAYVFRKVSHPVASWKYGIAAIIALLHDILFVLGIFSVLGKFAHIEITSSFIPAFLTVLGFSVHDTIVVFDRIRENLLKHKGSFQDIVNTSLNETMARSINTSLTVFLVLLSLYFFGGETLKTFALALLFGVGVGTYSSIFVASPLLVKWHEWTLKK